MAETESPLQKPPLPESAPSLAPSVGTPRVAIAISEENLAAFLGHEIVAPKPVAPTPAVEVPRASGPVSSVQENPNQEKPAPTPSAPRSTVSTTQNLESTLALLAAIKENRAGLRRSEAAAKPAVAAPVPEKVAETIEKIGNFEKVEKVEKIQRVEKADKLKTIEKLERPAAPVPAEPRPIVPAPVRANPAGPSAPRSRGTVYPMRAHEPAPVPAWAASRPLPPSRLAAAMSRFPAGRKGLLMLGACIAIGGISAGLVLRNHRSTKPTTLVSPMQAAAPAVTPANNFPLDLQVEPQGKGLFEVRWNPLSTLIAQAREGRLVVTETNQQPRTSPLAIGQLKLGHLLYPSQSERVEVRLEVVDASGSIAEESIQAPGRPANTGLNTAAQAPPPSPATPTPVPAPASPVTEAPAPARLAARAFTPPSKNPVEGDRTIVDIPPALPNSPVSTPLVSTQAPGTIAPPPTPAPSPAPVTRQIQVSTSLQAANLIRRVTPVYPPLARSARVQGVVRFRAVIGANGAIRNLEVVSGPPLLRQAAVDAVRQWVYRPTILNGQALEVLTEIEVNFTLGQ